MSTMRSPMLVHEAPSACSGTRKIALAQRQRWRQCCASRLTHDVAINCSPTGTCFHRQVLPERTRSVRRPCESRVCAVHRAATIAASEAWPKVPPRPGLRGTVHRSDPQMIPRRRELTNMGRPNRGRLPTPSHRACRCRLDILSVEPRQDAGRWPLSMVPRACRSNGLIASAPPGYLPGQRRHFGDPE